MTAYHDEHENLLLATPTDTDLVKADVADLIARVEKATGPDRELAADICEAVGLKVRRHSTTRFGRRAAAWAYLAPDDRRWHSVEPILSSIDAARALTERLLPGMGCTMWIWPNVTTATIGSKEIDFTEYMRPAGKGEACTAPLAIILATLRALEAKK